MTDIRTLLEKNGISGVREINYKKNNLYWGDYILGKNKNVIGRYCFAYTKYDFWKNEILENRDFVSNVIEPVFFQSRDDLRWNLYLVCIFNEENYKRIPLEEKIEFEQNTDYTRNMIILEGEFENWIPSGRSVGIRKNLSFKNPMEEWTEILEPLDMLFCLEPFSSERLEKYIKKTDAQIEEKLTEKNFNDNNGMMVRHIKSLQFDNNYRKECFGTNYCLEFGQANLLDGRNGAGKTSIMDAVEIAMTGNLRKNQDNYSEEAQANIEIEAVGSDDCLLNLKSPESLTEQIERENIWYQNKNNNKENSNLNQNFHIYNYFTVDDTFLFTYLGQQPSYEQNFSNMLFGPTTIKMQKSWKKYLEKVEDILYGISNEIEEKQNRLKKIKNDEPKRNPNVIEYIRQSEFAYKNNEDIDAVENRITAFIAVYDKVKEMEPIPSYKDLVLQKESLKLVQDNDVRDQLVKTTNQYNKKRSDRIEMETAYVEQQQKDGGKEKELSKILKLFKILLKNKGEYIYYQKLQNRQIELQQKFTSSDAEYYNKYYSLMKLEENWEELSPARDIWQKQMNKMSFLNEKEKEAKEQLDNEEAKTEEICKITEMLYSYGIRYVNTVEYIDACPLCGNVNADKKSICLNLKQTANWSNYESSRLTENYQNILRKKKNTQRILNLEESKMKEAEEVEMALAEGRHLGEFDCNDDLIKNPLKEVQSRLKYLKSIKDEKEENNKLICNWIDNTMKDYGLNKEDFERLDYYVEESKSILNVEENDDFWRLLEILVGGLEENLQEREKKEKELKERIEAARKIEKIYANETALLVRKIKEVEKKEHNYQRNLKRIDQQMMFWEEVRPYLKKENYDSAASVAEQAFRILKMISNDRMCMYWEQNVKSEENEIKRWIERKQAYAAMLETLNQLKPAEVYVQEFVRANIRQISRTFLSIHSPREFSELRLRGKELVAVRNGQDVPMYQLSTGQKTAAALSVFLEMNLSSSTAPGFLMLDEPVANIDDMNVLALLDYLREIVVSEKRQVFFTTANYNIAKLFRRKFSCLEDDFHEYSFRRGNSLYTKITLKTYDMKSKTREMTLEN